MDRKISEVTALKRMMILHTIDGRMDRPIGGPARRMATRDEQ